MQTALTIGTEYPDRLMIGTGTEDNPWIIGDSDHEQNLQNLLDALVTPSAYIKLTKDISAAQSVTYREGISHAITIAAAKLYADEKVKVSGLIINTDYCIQISGSITHTVENIQFMSLIHKGRYPAIYGLSNTLYPTIFSNCDFSGIKRSGGDIRFSMYAVRFSHCSINWDTTAAVGDSSGTVFDTSLKYEYCSICYKGPVHGYGYQTTPLLKNGDHVGIVGEISTSVSGTYLFDGCRYCYFAGMVDCSIMNTTIGCGLYSSNPQCLMCITETTGSYTLTKNTNITDVTPDQLRDRDYLYSIGFLP
ncbi:MAG: hypothetical protein E7503_06735 [Ruminococcus sp.]|nr:hypothetical protein [Ruminococcus sp.]